MVALRYQTAASGTNVIYQEPQQTFPLHGQVEVYWVRRMMLCQPRGSLRAVYSLELEEHQVCQVHYKAGL